MSFLIGRRILYWFNQTSAGWPISIGGLREPKIKLNHLMLTSSVDEYIDEC